MSPKRNRALLSLIVIVVTACGGTDTGTPAPAPEPEPGRGEPATDHPADPRPEEISPAPWDAARDRGATWRGIGQEPGWTVEIYPGDRIDYLGDYGETRVTLPAPEPHTDGRTTTWHATGNGHDLRVTFEELHCQDIMSGEEMPFTVTLSVDGQELRGCGRRL